MVAKPTVADFTLLINKQVEEHHQLAEHLLHVREVMGFTLSSDLKECKAAELHAQLLSVDALLEEAQKHNEALQARLSDLCVSD